MKTAWARKMVTHHGNLAEQALGILLGKGLILRSVARSSKIWSQLLRVLCISLGERGLRVAYLNLSTLSIRPATPDTSARTDCKMALLLSGSSGLLHSQPRTLSRTSFKTPVTVRRTVSERASKNTPNWLLSQPNRLWEIGSRYW